MKSEDSESFENRKKDHIKWSLSSESQLNLSPSKILKFEHSALPDINFKDLDIKTTSELYPDAKPFMVSSMTGGHQNALTVNTRLLSACEKKNWIFSTGSLRRELDEIVHNDESSYYVKQWRDLRDKYDKVVFIGNLGVSQIVDLDPHYIKKLTQALNLDGIFIHLNPLQEVLQPEGTPNFKGGLLHINKLAESLEIPVLVKETGSGFSKETLEKFKESKLGAIDVAGLGGTHWGRVEGLRSTSEGLLTQVSQTYKNWGVSTVNSIFNFNEVFTEKSNLEVWSSGGLRTGLDAALSIAIGASVCGFAKPMMEAALEGEDDIVNLMNRIEYELKTALFCTDSQNLKALQSKKGIVSWI